MKRGDRLYNELHLVTYKGNNPLTLAGCQHTKAGCLKEVVMSDKVEEGKEEQPKEEPKTLEWKPWHDALPKEAQALIAEREGGLKSALGTERDARQDAEKELRKAAAALEKGSEAQKQLEQSADDLAALSTKAEFYEEAHKAGVSNLKLAFHVATTEDLFDKRGAVDFDKMKEAFPELFGKKAPPRGDAGEGTGPAPGGKDISMNAFIRRSAGKQ